MEGAYPAVRPLTQPLPLTLFDVIPGDLLEAIERDFGSFDIFRAEMTAKTVAIEGSGWGWLVRSYSFFYFCGSKKNSGNGPIKRSWVLSNCHFIVLKFLVLVWSRKKKHDVLCV